MQNNIKGQTITDTIRKEVSVPIKEYVPSEPQYIYKSVYIVDVERDPVIQIVDNAAIISDWISLRNYPQTLFDNQNGKLGIDLSVQYNKLQSLQYSFTPVRQVNTIYKEKI